MKKILAVICLVILLLLFSGCPTKDSLKSEMSSMYDELFEDVSNMAYYFDEYPDTAESWMSGAEEDLALLKTKAQAYKESNGYDEYYTQDYETALEALVLLIDSGEKLSDAHSTYSKLQFGTIQVDDPEVTKTVENLGKALQNLATCSELVDTIVDTERWQPEKQKQNIENLSNAITNFAQDFLGFVGYYS